MSCHKRTKALVHHTTQCSMLLYIISLTADNESCILSHQNLVMENHLVHSFQKSTVTPVTELG